MNRGEGTSSTCLICHNNRLIYVRYKDHVLYRNSDPQLYNSPNIRETIGWLLKETDEALFLTHDRSIKPLPYEKRESGLIIMKSNVVERRKVE